jgi:Uma2 family endonuclease
MPNIPSETEPSMRHAKLNPWSEADYLRAERDALVRHEYVAGRIFAMAGGTKAHNTIALNVAAHLKTHLRGSRCRTFIAGMKVRVEKAHGYYYPDVVVTCHPKDLSPDSPIDYLTQPSLIVEVLSPSTETIDRREKLLAYACVPGPLEYVLLDSATRLVEIYRKDASGELVQEIPERDEPVHLESVGLSLTFEAIYEDAGVG